MESSFPKRTGATIFFALLLMVLQGLWGRAPKSLPNRVYLRTVPAGAAVSMTQAASIKGVRDKEVGRSPGPLDLSPNERSRFVFRLALAGYHPQTVEISRSELVSDQVLIRLRPQIPLLIPFLYRLRDYPFWVLALFVLGHYGAFVLRPHLASRRVQATLWRDGELKPGLKFHGYELLRVIGRGAGGTTFLAKSESSESERYALKALLLKNRDVQEAQNRLKREWQACMSVEHPSIMRLYDWGEINGTLYLVSEYIDGRPLGSSLPLPPDEACRWTLQILEAMNHAHHLGIVHRDLKPDNIMLTSAGSIKLLDFGISAWLGETNSGVEGTPGYMAPEQANGVVAPCNDYYSLGVIFYELLTGVGPFRGDGLYPILALQSQKDFTRLSSLCPELPRDFEELIEKLLEPDPAQRLCDRYAVSAALNDCKASLTSSTER